MFAPLFQYHDSPPATDPRIPLTAAGVESLAQIAAKAMLEAAQPRSFPAMTELNSTSIATRIAECVRRNVPIAAQILWSPKKHWITGPDSYIDLAELAALNTLLRVHTTVRNIYRPGLTFTIDLEDIEFEFMEGAEPELVWARTEYIGGLRKAIRVFGLDDCFLANRISGKAKDKHELQSWMAQMELNYRAL